ncbi:MAG: hypothetical protein ABI520_16150 [Caldimonas sp.]
MDLRGLRATLAARAAAEALTESEVLRSALVAKLGPDAVALMPAPRMAPTAPRRPCAKLSIRLPNLAAHRLDQNSRASGMSRGAYLARLIDGVAPVVASSDRIALAKALNQSAEELAVLSRDIHHLTELLRRGSVESARQYRERLDTLDADVRAHLERDAKVLAELSVARSTERPLAPARTPVPGQPT